MTGVISHRQYEYIRYVHTEHLSLNHSLNTTYQTLSKYAIEYKIKQARDDAITMYMAHQ